MTHSFRRVVTSTELSNELAQEVSLSSGSVVPTWWIWKKRIFVSVAEIGLCPFCDLSLSNPGRCLS